MGVEETYSRQVCLSLPLLHFLKPHHKPPPPPAPGPRHVFLRSYRSEASHEGAPGLPALGIGLDLYFSSPPCPSLSNRTLPAPPPSTHLLQACFLLESDNPVCVKVLMRSFHSLPTHHITHYILTGPLGNNDLTYENNFRPEML